MCVVSMVGDHYNDKFEKNYPGVWPDPLNSPPITRQEFDELKRDVKEMKELLKRAKKYDEDNNEPDCEIAEKFKKLQEIAKLVNIDLDELGLNIKK